jgi:hypothetical protein
MAVRIAFIIEQIKLNRGNLAAVGRACRISRQSVFERVARSVPAQRALEEARQTMLDDAENTLYERALAGNTAELIFFLKTQGKMRGYVERQEVTTPMSEDYADPFATIERRIAGIRAARLVEDNSRKLIN